MVHSNSDFSCSLLYEWKTSETSKYPKQTKGAANEGVGYWNRPEKHNWFLNILNVFRMINLLTLTLTSVTALGTPLPRCAECCHSYRTFKKKMTILRIVTVANDHFKTKLYEILLFNEKRILSITTTTKCTIFWID